MATLYRDTGEPVFLDAARGVARYLQEIARTEGGVFLVPYGVPNEGYVRPYDIGWAHGPAGTARFFHQMTQLAGDDTYPETVEAAARGILASGLPGPPDAVFGEEPFKPDLRFGTASVAMFFLDLYRTTGDAEYLQYATRLTDDLLARATRDETGLRWAFPRYDFLLHGGDLAAFTGYFYGAAGYGLLLLRLDAALQETPWQLRLPDDPFVD
jgi:rhamnogalacturonyl hydrolase YesR